MTIGRRNTRSGQKELIMAAASSTDYLETTTLKQILDISDAAMDQAMAIAYQLYLTRRFAEAETICRGLIACDHRYWWPRSLHASVLRRLGRHEEALAAVEEGLKYEPRQPKLLLMRAELVVSIARARAAASTLPTTTTEAPSSAGTPRDGATALAP
jgi:predicted Zn-dependent protease